MPGKCPKKFRVEFKCDVEAGLTTKELSSKYKRAERTIQEWRKSLIDLGVIVLPSTEEKHTPTDDTPPGVRVAVEDNTMVATSGKSKRIKSLDDLIAAIDLDTKVWHCDRHEVNKYEVGAKQKTGNLSWLGGVVTGELQYDGLQVHELWQVKAWFTRVEPVAIQPVIQPVAPVGKYDFPTLLSGIGKAKKHHTLVGADMQMGFYEEDGVLHTTHDREAISLFVYAARALKPSVIVLLGDNADLSDLTDRFAKDSRYAGFLQKVIFELHFILETLRKENPDARIIFHQGNHEKRFQSYMMAHFEQVYNLRSVIAPDTPWLSLRNLLGLDALGIEWVGGYPDDITYLTPDLALMHGDKTSNVIGTTAQKMLEGLTHSVVYAHQHRIESACKTIVLPGGAQGVIEAHGVGCLCKTDGTVPGARKRANWQKGFSVITFNRDLFGVQPVHIRGKRALINGIDVEGQSYKDALCKAHPSERF